MFWEEHTQRKTPKAMENQPLQQNEDILTAPAGHPLRALGYSPHKSFLYLYLLGSTLRKVYIRTTGQRQARAKSGLMILNIPQSAWNEGVWKPGRQERQKAASLHQKHHHESWNSRTNSHKRGNFMEPYLFHKSQLMNQWGNED